MWLNLHAPSAVGTAICLVLGLADLIAGNLWGVPAAWPELARTPGVAAHEPERRAPRVASGHPTPALPNESAAPAHGNAIPAETAEAVAAGAPPPASSPNPLTLGDGVSVTAQPVPTTTSRQDDPSRATVPPDSGPLLSAGAAADDPGSRNRRTEAEPSETPPQGSPPVPFPAPQPAPQSLTVHFGSDRVAVPAAALEPLQQLAARLLREPSERVEIEGHADHRGDSSYNQRLSERRAESVAAFLVERGVASGRIRILGSGTSRPLDKADNSRAWARNRRVEARIIQATR